MTKASLPPPFPADCRMVVFDLDGTLYRQSRLRRAMLVQLLTAGGPGKLARVRDLRIFRHLREQASDAGQAGFEAALYAEAARRTGRGEAAMRALVQDWMEERPLPHLRAARVAGTAELFAALRARGIVVAVWSDYPVKAKLAALGLTADHMLAATDAEVAALKPNPRGLSLLLERTGLDAAQVLMVGDRMERDGAAAAALGVAFLLRAAKGPDGVARVADFAALARMVEASAVQGRTVQASVVQGS